MKQSQTSTNPPDQSTIGPDSVQSQSDPLLAIILGTVGGLIGDEEQLVDCGLTMLTGSNSCAPAGVVCRGQKMKLLVMKV